MVAIFVLSFFLLILITDLVVLYYKGKYHPAFEPSFAYSEFFGIDVKDIAVPNGVLISRGHTWLKKNSNDLFEVGVDAFGTVALGDLAIEKCAEPGKKINRGDIIFEGRYGNKNVKFISPVNCVVKSVNQNVIGKSIANPYSNWAIQVDLTDRNENLKTEMSGRKALSWILSEFTNLKNFIDEHTSNPELAGVTMFDGGAVSDDVASLLTDKSITQFEKEFLSF